MLKKDAMHKFVFWLSLMVFSPSVFAVALGPAVVKSRMGQPFEAEIPIIATSDEIRNVIVRLAPGSQYTKLGINYKYFLRHIQGEVIRNQKNKEAYFRLFSRTPMFEPQLQIVLEAVWPNGHSYRSYVFLVEPSEDLNNLVRLVNRPQSSQQRLPGDVKVIHENEIIPLQIISEPDYRSPLSKKPYQASPSSQYQVKRGDTLSGIAKRFYQGSASLEQVMISIQQANPGKFIRNNINLIPTGVVLNIPTSKTIERSSHTQALAQVRQQNQAWRRYIRRAQKKGSESTMLVSEQKTKSNKVLISSGSSEELIAKRKELQEITSRLEELKKIVSQQRELMNYIKDQRNQ